MSRSPLAIIFLTVFLDLIGFGMIVPLIGVYGRYFGASGVELGALGAIFSIMQFLFAPVWGSLSDRFGRRPILLIGLFGSTFSYAGFALAGSFGALFATRLFAGVFAANVSAAQAYIADVTKPEERAKGMGLIGAAFGLGFMLGPPLGGIAAAKIGLSAPGWIACAICGFNAVWALARLPESLPLKNRKTAPLSMYFPLSPERLKPLRKHPFLWILVLQFFLVVFAFSNLEQTFALLFQEKFDFDTREAAYRTGLVLMCASFFGAFIQGKYIKPLVARFGEYRLFVFGLFLQWIGMMVFPMGSSFAVYYVLVLPVAIGQALVNPTINAMISRAARADEQGAVLGLAQGVGALARAVGPFVGLSAFGVFYGLPYAIAANAIFVVVLLAAMLRRRL